LREEVWPYTWVAEIKNTVELKTSGSVGKPVPVVGGKKREQMEKTKVANHGQNAIP